MPCTLTMDDNVESKNFLGSFEWVQNDWTKGREDDGNA